MQKQRQMIITSVVPVFCQPPIFGLFSQHEHHPSYPRCLKRSFETRVKHFTCELGFVWWTNSQLLISAIPGLLSCQLCGRLRTRRAMRTVLALLQAVDDTRLHSTPVFVFSSVCDLCFEFFVRVSAFMQSILTFVCGVDKSAVLLQYFLLGRNPRPM